MPLKLSIRLVTFLALFSIFMSHCKTSGNQLNGDLSAEDWQARQMGAGVRDDELFQGFDLHYRDWLSPCWTIDPAQTQEVVGQLKITQATKNDFPIMIDPRGAFCKRDESSTMTANVCLPTFPFISERGQCCRFDTFPNPAIGTTLPRSKKIGAAQQSGEIPDAPLGTGFGRWSNEAECLEPQLITEALLEHEALIHRRPDAVAWLDAIDPTSVVTLRTKYPNLIAEIRRLRAPEFGAMQEILASPMGFPSQRDSLNQTSFPRVIEDMEPHADDGSVGRVCELCQQTFLDGDLPETSVRKFEPFTPRNRSSVAFQFFTEMKKFTGERPGEEPASERSVNIAKCVMCSRSFISKAHGTADRTCGSRKACVTQCLMFFGLPDLAKTGAVVNAMVEGKDPNEIVRIIRQNQR